MVMLAGERGGSQFFGSLGFSADLQVEGPKVRRLTPAYQFVRSRLDSYSERAVRWPR